MAESKTKKEATKVAEYKPSKMVTISLPRAERNQANFITASCNGKTYKIMKGQPVEVPRELAAIIANAEIAKDDAFKYIEANSN